MRYTISGSWSGGIFGTQHSTNLKDAIDKAENMAIYGQCQVNAFHGSTYVEKEGTLIAGYRWHSINGPVKRIPKKELEAENYFQKINKQEQD